MPLYEESLSVPLSFAPNQMFLEKMFQIKYAISTPSLEKILANQDIDSVKWYFE